MSTATEDLSESDALHHIPGAGTRDAAPILFVHGAFATPWVWQRNFMPWFADRGHDVYAVALEGASAASGGLLEPGLQDYVDDVEAAARSIGGRPIVVGHSLGALVAQMVLGRFPMSGLALLAPAPPTGMFWSSVRLALNAPTLWARTAISTADAGFASASATREAMFTDTTDNETVNETHRNLRPQPARPLMEAQWPRHVPRAERLEVPVLTMAAEQDRLIPGDVVERTAQYHGASHVTLDGSAHAMMLDDGWRDAADAIARWVDDTIDQHPPNQSTTER